uniref:Protein pinocchio n=1 Tax=Cuerna arida TaxID=1464854 RepID=A0A1B6FP82_9HEMI
MSLAGVQPTKNCYQYDNDDKDTVDHSVLIANSLFEEFTVLSIEELREQIYSCFTCGVRWLEDQVCLDCKECGGYSLERPCLRCDGNCDALWKRDLTMSHACGKARWNGQCQLECSTSGKGTQEPLTREEQLVCKLLNKLALRS